MIFGKGYRPDAHDPRDWKLSELELAGRVRVADPPERVDMDGALAPVRDQGQWGSCVAMGFARAIHTRANLARCPLREYPSEAGIYGGARELENPPPGPLPDDGTFPRLAAKTVSVVGVVAESAFPYSRENLQHGLGLDVARIGASARLLPARGLGYYRISGARDVKRALAAGYPVPLGLSIDQAFEDYRAGIYSRGGAARGGHMVCAVGYLGDVVQIINSWSTGWGDAGFAWIPSWFLDDPAFCFDAYALDFADLAI